ncbi:MAG TPA: sulfur carrier protein ThiS [Candidatus Tyrphobacter sp.]
MTAIVNGNVRELPENVTIGDLLELLGTPRSGIAVACNDAVIGRGSYDEHHLVEGDRVEIIKAVAGG